MIKLTDLCAQEEKLAPGHRACSGCAETIIVRQVLSVIKEPVVVGIPTGCLEVVTTPFPYTSWRIPCVHNLFENAASTISGAEAAYKALVRRGAVGGREIRFMVFAGDGATYDIGFQWLSGVLERGHRMLYVCLNNEAYMNTGTQRSSATHLGTWTTTTPVGKVLPGKSQHRKDLTAIIAAHNIPYVAQAAPHAWKDLMTKVQKAVAADGPSFINVLAPCPRGWRHDPSKTIAISRLAAETCMWPLFEVESGVWKLNYIPKEKKPVTEYLKSQGRFAHLLRPENEPIVAELQRRIDLDWAKLREASQR
jgi:pyruvate ferredoxin oxidoreductase beta subunit